VRKSNLFTLIGVLLATVLLDLNAPWARADDSVWSPQSLVYKVAGSTKIEADIYRRNGEVVRPAVVWIHGGALILGNRKSVPRDISTLCQERNYVLISLDYRLAPEVKLPAIIDDLKDAFRWINAKGMRDFHLDPKRILVCGSSAGGYLTMISGYCIEPRPKALVAYWGYGDVDGAWYNEPAHLNIALVKKDDAYRVVGGDITTGNGGQSRGVYYVYLRQNGLWTKEVTGMDPKTDRAKLNPYCPVRNITAAYPAILMVHGTADKDVPFAKSVEMAEALSKQGVPHELVTVPGAGHDLDGADERVIGAARAKALEFIRQELD